MKRKLPCELPDELRDCEEAVTVWEAAKASSADRPNTTTTHGWRITWIPRPQTDGIRSLGHRSGDLYIRDACGSTVIRSFSSLREVLLQKAALEGSGHLSTRRVCTASNDAKPTLTGGKRKQPIEQQQSPEPTAANSRPRRETAMSGVAGSAQSPSNAHEADRPASSFELLASDATQRFEAVAQPLLVTSPKRKHRFGAYAGCLAADCGQCAACQDKPKVVASSHTSLVVYTPPSKQRWRLPAHLKGSGCSKCRFEGCRSCCKDARGGSDDANDADPTPARPSGSRVVGVEESAVARPRQTHKGYAHAISPRPEQSTPLFEGQRVAVYFDAPDDGWYEGLIATRAAVGDSVCVRFDDGEHPVELLAQSYGRFNLWVAPDPMRQEEWSAGGHELLGRQLVHEGTDGLLRMWCAARRLFAMSVCDDAAANIEAEVLVSESDATAAVTAATRRKQKRRAESVEEEGPPPLALPHGRAQAALPSLRELGDAIPLLRRQIVSGSSRRGVHDAEQTCVNDDLAALLGVKIKGFKVLFRALRDGQLPGKLMAPDQTWVDPAECAERLHAMRFWVGRGIVEIGKLREKLVGSSAAWREELQAKKQVHGSPPLAELSSSAMCAPGEGRAMEGAPTSPLAQPTPLALDWMREEDELKRAVMVSVP